MALSVVQRVSDNSGADNVTSLNLTVTEPSQNNLLVLVVVARDNDSADGDITISGMTGWTRAVSSHRTLADNLDASIWYKVAGASEGTTVTVNLSNSKVAATFSEVSGAATVSPLDKTASGDGVGTSAATSATGTLSQANEYAIAGIGVAGTGITFSSWADSFTERAEQDTTSAGGNAVCQGAADLITSATTSITPGATLSTSDDWVAVAATFKEAGTTNFDETGRSITATFTVSNGDALTGASSTFPSVAGSASSTEDSETTSHTVDLPGSISAGDLLLMFLTVDGGSSGVSWPSGWTQLLLSDDFDGSSEFGVAWRKATGSEGGTATVTTTESEQSAHAVLRITGAADPTVTPPNASWATQVTNQPNPPSLTPAAGAKNYLWIGCYGADAGQEASSYPAGYSGGTYIESGGAGGDVSLGYAYRQLNASTENPGPFTIASSETLVRATIAVHPDPSSGTQYGETGRNISIAFTVSRTDSLNEVPVEELGFTVAVSTSVSDTYRVAPPVISAAAAAARVSPDYEVVLVARSPQSSGSPIFTELEALPWSDLRWSDELNAYGEADIAINLSATTDTAKSRLANLYDLPSEVRIYRGSTLVWAGPVVAVQGQQDRALRLVCRSLLYYYRYQHLLSDLVFFQADQLTIARGLAEHWQTAVTYGNFGLDTTVMDDPESGVLRDRTYTASDLHNVYDRMVELAEVSNGFDLWVDPSERIVYTAYPQRGVVRSLVFDDRVIEDPSIVLSVAAEDVASDAYAVGASADEDSPPITSTQSNGAARAKFGATSVVGSAWNVTEQSTLDDFAEGLIENRGAVLLDPTVSMRPVPGADVDDFDVGDTISFALDVGLGLTLTSRRVASKSVTYNRNTGDEQVEVTFV